MIRPPLLRPGDVVRVVAPSGPIDPEVLDRGLGVLRDLGLEVRLRSDVTSRRGYLAGDDGRRLEEWREAASDRDARAIFCARGGYGAMRLLPRLEPARLLHPPRWVVGFSDVTAIHAALNQAGLITVHGPMVSTLPRSTPESLDHLRALLFGPDAAPPSGRPGVPRPGTGVVGTGVIRPGRAAGTLLGGSLSILAHLCGTPWLPRMAGAVLFLEDVDERPYRLDRYLTQLRLAGALDGVRAVCVGQLTQCDYAGQSGAETVRELVRAMGVPAIDGIAAGHEGANLALPLGALVSVVAPASGEDGPPRLEWGPGPAAGVA